MSAVTRIVVVLAVTLLVLAPIQAVLWSRIPFPGFLVEPTLVVADVGDTNWSGHAAGINGPQKVVALDGKMVGDREVIPGTLIFPDPRRRGGPDRDRASGQ